MNDWKEVLAWGVVILLLLATMSFMLYLVNADGAKYREADKVCLLAGHDDMQKLAGEYYCVDKTYTSVLELIDGDINNE